MTCCVERCWFRLRVLVRVKVAGAQLAPLPSPQPHVPLYVSKKSEGKTERGPYGDVIAEIDLAADALEGSLFRMLRQGQRVNFELDAEGRATALKLGSEADMSTPDL